AESDRFFIRRETSSVKQNWIEVIHEGNLDTQATSLGFIKLSALGSYVLQSSLNTQLANYVPINGVTTINNTKTFTSSPVVPNGTLNGHAVNLGQLNELLGGFLSKNESNTVTEEFAITNGWGTLRLSDGFAMHVEIDGIAIAEIASEDGYAISYRLQNGNIFEADVNGFYGKNGTNEWQLRNNGGKSNLVMPNT